MSLYSFNNIRPQIEITCYIADGAHVIGKVIMQEHASVWHNCVLRGDVNSISIGSCTNVQDLSMLHVTEALPLVLEDNVTIGHNVTLHSCYIEKNALIGSLYIYIIGISNFITVGQWHRIFPQMDDLIL